ncbi:MULTISPECIES: hypothetical protein [unclassified Streptomyces]|uniref:hypothetical protein n=1 Tax=unclassified Streptomyces TaxID=2593676 RepID=UPI0006ADA9DC|nr:MULTISPECIES: hypothetical protein [unclassified Streptomyces]KOX19774.1 hypothetical protein ADL06_28675 [Streptomyces sp. NRRL F-6491]KOX37897.1 hypothetical protein ADL08_28390 [Streptomyces sp. NRRL F-6492]
MLSDEDVLAAVRRGLQERGEAGQALPEEADISRHLLLDGKILRSVETRTEEERFHQGFIDLSDRPVYRSSIHAHRIPPPEDPASETTLELVRRGSVDDRSCDCGNGLVACERCKGVGELPCVPARACGDCHGIAGCLWCDGTGRRGRQSRDRGDAGRAGREGRVTCGQCGTREAACAGCGGRGKITCARCDGTGSRACPDCDRAGTVPHRRCGGTARTVTWTEGVITRSPFVVKVKVSTPVLPYGAWRSARDHGDWTDVRVVGERSSLARDVEERVAGILEPWLTPHEGEVGRRVTLRHLSLARVTLASQPHRVFFVVPAHDGPYVAVWPSEKRARLIGAVALAALVTLVVVWRLLA